MERTNTYTENSNDLIKIKMIVVVATHVRKIWLSQQILLLTLKMK